MTTHINCSMYKVIASPDSKECLVVTDILLIGCNAILIIKQKLKLKPKLKPHVRIMTMLLHEDNNDAFEVLVFVLV